MNWKNNSRPAQHWKHLTFDNKDIVQCQLCPRTCLIPNDTFGFCGVRGSIDNVLHTFNFGKSVAATEENIETEAIFHYAPGARILSLGNIGCMMNCDFCQNWETSQVKFLDDKVVHSYSPDDIITLCKESGISIISWTYQDPVVWHEFVLETSKIARVNGIKTIYKSALYIQEAPLNELIDCIDIFSISLKSMSEKFYKKYTKADLLPILDRIVQIHQSTCHLEISQLLVTGLNDTQHDVQKTIDWVINTIGKNVPLHFVGFHPAYKFTDVSRTPLSTLLSAQKIAVNAGIRYCYLGNVFENNINNTHCLECGAVLVKRYGLNSRVTNINSDNTCTICGAKTPFKFPLLNKNKSYRNKQRSSNFVNEFEEISIYWKDSINSVHISLDHTRRITSFDTITFTVTRLNTKIDEILYFEHGMNRKIISRKDSHEIGIKIKYPKYKDIKIMKILDRAHFPVNIKYNYSTKRKQEYIDANK